MASVQVHPSSVTLARPVVSGLEHLARQAFASSSETCGRTAGGQLVVERSKPDGSTVESFILALWQAPAKLLQLSHRADALQGNQDRL